jgi:hypothetical protein
MSEWVDNLTLKMNISIIIIMCKRSIVFSIVISIHTPDSTGPKWFSCGLCFLYSLFLWMASLMPLPHPKIWQSGKIPYMSLLPIEWRLWSLANLPLKMARSVSSSPSHFSLQEVKFPLCHKSWLGFFWQDRIMLPISVWQRWVPEPHRLGFEIQRITMLNLEKQRLMVPSFQSWKLIALGVQAEAYCSGLGVLHPRSGCLDSAL